MIQRLAYLLSFLYPRTLEQATSVYNRDIRVIKDAGFDLLLVDGVHQSSHYIAKFWDHALRHLELPRVTSVKNILMCGVAGGTVIRMFSALYPNARIKGLDIDSHMIELGKKYFGIGNIPNLSFVVADVCSYVKKNRTQRYDLVIVDIYIGRYLPEFLHDRAFLVNIRAMLRPKGCVIINYLQDGEYAQKALILEKKLTSIYSHVSYTNYRNNRFFLAQK